MFYSKSTDSRSTTCADAIKRRRRPCTSVVEVSKQQISVIAEINYLGCHKSLLYCLVYFNLTFVFFFYSYYTDCLHHIQPTVSLIQSRITSLMMSHQPVPYVWIMTTNCLNHNWLALGCQMVLVQCLVNGSSLLKHRLVLCVNRI